MGDVIEIIKNTASTLVDGVEVVKDSIGIVFNIFPSDIKALFMWGVGFILVVSVVKFVKS